MTPLFPFAISPPAQSFDHRIPARIRVALELLDHLSAKTADRPAGGDVSQIVEGQKLTPSEEDVQRTACHILVQYCEGKLKPDSAEALHLQELGRPRQRGFLISCLACDPGHARVSCLLCGGSGKSIINPATEQ